MSFDPIKIKSLRALHDSVIVSDMNFSGRSLSSGILLLADDSKTTGIRPRWAQVYAIGPNQKDIQVGQWICVAHGRWTRGVKIQTDDGEKVVRKVDINDILLVSDQQPGHDDSLSD